MKRHDEDTQAILARREAFVKSVLSKNEIDSAKGGSIGICLSIEPCLSIIPPSQVEDDSIGPCLSIYPCLSIEPPSSVENSIFHDPYPCLSP